jgi:DNA-3-methyladenine glycosylase I
MSYCAYISQLGPGEQILHRQYHDEHYGFPIASDNELFGRLLLEINQAGLSWTTILNKQENFRKAYSQFNIEAVAAYTEDDRQRLLNDAGIIRNRLKVEAAIFNSKTIGQLQQEFGSFGAWLLHHHPLPKAEWVKLFKKTFRFTGGEIVNEFLMSCGFLPGAHQPECPVYQRVIAANPPWLQA